MTIYSNDENGGFGHYNTLLPTDLVPFDKAELRSYACEVFRYTGESYREAARRTGISKSALHRIRTRAYCNWQTAALFLHANEATERRFKIIFGDKLGIRLYRELNGDIERVETIVRYL